MTSRGKIPLRPTRADATTELAQISMRSTDDHDQIQVLTASTNLAGLLHVASCWTRFRLCRDDGRCGLEPTAAFARWISALHCKQPASRTTTHTSTNSDHRSAMITHDRRRHFTHNQPSNSSIICIDPQHSSVTPHPFASKASSSVCCYPAYPINNNKGCTVVIIEYDFKIFVKALRNYYKSKITANTKL